MPSFCTQTETQPFRFLPRWFRTWQKPQANKQETKASENTAEDAVTRPGTMRGSVRQKTYSRQKVKAAKRLLQSTKTCHTLAGNRKPGLLRPLLQSFHSNQERMVHHSLWIPSKWLSQSLLWFQYKDQPKLLPNTQIETTC